MRWNDTAHHAHDERPLPSREHERALVMRVQGGDPHAFATLVSTYIESLTRFAFYLLRSHDAADDVVQKVFIAFWHSRTTIDPDRPLKPYLFRSVRNQALNERKANTIRDRYRNERQVESEAGTLPASTPSPETFILTKETIQAAINELPERRQIALRLRIQDELTHSEIAEILGVTPEAAQRLVSRAVSDLRKKIGVSD